MNKQPETPKTSQKKTTADPEMEGPFAEKDEVKKAENKMRKAAATKTK
ncbi:hypothetical protein [Mucilaginibacter ginkgonis]|uniref:Uncharacterized protein n=1 Tax=Mucilaginibacter ginkgonis TaxID=2682091 RepID=A0A6I4I243_9SPHI|nr:hypothetical protein [Mucilaginibacter ginkgonis]QQL50910.1 hypothetical protein GO620_005495 [Mucilaginibacter ginkgonis]